MKNLKKIRKEIKKNPRKQKLLMKEISLLMNEGGYVNINKICMYTSGKHFPLLRTAFLLSTTLKVPLEILYKDLFQDVKEGVENRRKELFTKAQSREMTYEDYCRQNEINSKKECEYI